MAQSAPSVLFPGSKVRPLYGGQQALELDVNLPPNVTYPAGQVLGPVTSSANDVQTVSLSGSPTGGTFTLTGVNPLTQIAFTTNAIAYNISAAALQTELQLWFGTGNVTVTGTGPWTVTAAGAMVNMPVPVMALGTNSLTGGSSPTASVAHTTIGATAGTYAAYNSAVAAVPAAPTVSGTGSGSAFAAGTYLVQITGVNAQGETTPSPAAPVTLTAAQKIRVAAQSSLDASFTSLNVYVDGSLVGSCAVSAGTSTQTDFDVASLAVKGTPPLVNTAYTIPNGAGTQNAKAILQYACATDASGQITLGTVSGGGQWGQARRDTPAWFSGYFDTSVLTGLDSKAVSDLGKLTQGTTTAGILRAI